MAGYCPIPTWLDTIIVKVEARLVTTGLFTADYVFSSLTEDQGEAPPGTDVYAVVVPGPQRPSQSDIDGGGNDNPTLNAELGVILWNRLSVDMPQRDDAFLTDATYGSLRQMRLVFKALQLFNPQDAGSNYLTEEGLRLSDGGWMVRNRKAKLGWAPVASSWEFKYLADLS